MKFLPIIIAFVVVALLAYRYRNRSGGESDFDDYDFD